MKPTIFAPAARAEFEAAAEWYETHADGLGERFVSCVGEIIGRIEASPVDSPSGMEIVASGGPSPNDSRTSSSFVSSRTASR